MTAAALVLVLALLCAACWLTGYLYGRAERGPQWSPVMVAATPADAVLASVNAVLEAHGCALVLHGDAELVRNRRQADRLAWVVSEDAATTGAFKLVAIKGEGYGNVG